MPALSVRPPVSCFIKAGYAAHSVSGFMTVFMSSYENHQALDGLTLGKSTDYRDNYDASLLRGVPRG